mgnify:CR=1 FL=1
MIAVIAINGNAFFILFKNFKFKLFKITPKVTGNIIILKIIYNIDFSYIKKSRSYD